jgi:Tol biopolymer transport system component
MAFFKLRFQFIYSPISVRVIFALLFCLALTAQTFADDKDDKKKNEKLRIKKLTQGMGLHAIGPVSPDGRSVLLLAQKPDSSPNLYVMDLTDYSIRAPLTSFKWGVTDPVWSPDGHRVVFAASNESGSFSEVYTLELKTGKLSQLTRNQFTDNEPVFTPDGKSILFTSDASPLPDAAFGILHVAIAPVAGGKAEYFTEEDISTIRPGISADQKGALLLKINENSGRHSLWLYGFDGKAQRDLTGRKFARIHRYIVHPAAQLIVFWAQEEAEQQDEIYILDLKSGEIRALPEPDLPKRNPAISPDGKAIAFIAPTQTGAHIFLFDSTTGQIQQLTLKGVNNYSPVFVSNKEILFGSDRDKANELYLIDLTPPPPDEKKKK